MNTNKLMPNAETVKAYFAGHYRDFYASFLDLKNGTGKELKAVCPFHEDKDPSLSINDATGLFHCFGCQAKGDAFKFYGKVKGFSSFPEIVAGICQDFGIEGKTPAKDNRNKIRATYDYLEETGKILLQVVKFEPKGFRQRQPDGKGGWKWNLKGVRRVLYRLPEIIKADLVLITEGEKDADNIASMGLAATTCAGGAGKWREEYSQALRGKAVVILPDNDDPGRKHAEQVAEVLSGIAKSVKVVALPGLPEKGDVSDWLKAGGTRKALESLINGTPVWTKADSFVWESPILLGEFQPPSFDSRCLPGVLGRMAEATMAATETPIELPAGLMLAIIATAVQGKMKINVKSGYSEPLCIWTVAFLDSGNRKSSVQNSVSQPLNTWEAKKRDQMAPVIRKLESERKNQESRLKSLRARYGKAKASELDQLQNEILEIETGLQEPQKYPKIWVQDVTPEHLGTLLGLHDGRMSILSAEGGIFDIIAGRYSNGIPNLDVFLQSHSGDGIRVDRGNRDPIYLESPSLTFGLSPQPDVLKEIAEVKGFRGRGLLARFLFLIPKSNLGYRTLESKPIPETVSNEWETAIHTLLSIEPQRGQDGRIRPFVINLSRAAYAEWHEFSQAVEKEMREGGRFESMTDWAGKFPGAAARLAGLLHCVQNSEQPWAEEVSLKTMQQTLDLAATFATHAEAAFESMGADRGMDGARRIWTWVERGRLASFTKRDCFYVLKSAFRRVSEIEEPLLILEERNYLASTTRKTGGRPSIEYTVNPELVARWA
jgi:putative DNA primase/helicase